jgi:hypothetical protein
MLFIIINALHVSGGFSAHHQELINCMCSLGYCHAFLLSIAGVDGLEQPIHNSVDSIYRWCGWVGTTHPQQRRQHGLEQPIQISGRQQKSIKIPKTAYTVF